MKVLLFNGSPHENGCTSTALAEMETRLHENGIETERFYIGTAPVASCTACGACGKLGKCIFGDLVNDFGEKAKTADGFVFGSPVYYASPSAQCLSFMDRLFFAYGKIFDGKPACSVVSCRRGGASAAFDVLNKYFLMNNMPVVPSQYWNQVHGSTPDDVRKDEEGLQTMRTLADNMAWMIKSFAAAKAAGIEKPQREPVQRTNFIRG